MQQKNKNRQFSNQGLWKASGFKSKSSHFLRICKESLKSILICWINFVQRVTIPCKRSQWASFRIKKSASCNNLNQKFYSMSDLEARDYNVSVLKSKFFNESDFESQCLNPVIFRVKTLQPVTFPFKVFTTCHNLQQIFETRQYSNRKFYNVSDSKWKNSQRVKFSIDMLTTCQLLNRKIQNVAVLKPKSSQCVTVCKQSVKTLLIFWIKLLRRVRKRFKKLQPVRCRIKFSTTCKFLKPKI